MGTGAELVGGFRMTCDDVFVDSIGRSGRGLTAVIDRDGVHAVLIDAGFATRQGGVYGRPSRAASTISRFRTVPARPVPAGRSGITDHSRGVGVLVRRSLVVRDPVARGLVVGPQTW